MPFITQNFLASTIKANGVTLSSSFDYSQLDIETDPTTFFPKTGKQEFGFTQQWGPEANEYILNPQGQLQGGNLKKQDLYKIDDESIGSLNPVINVPSNKHQQILKICCGLFSEFGAKRMME